ncbi:MAG: sigma-54 dependent transcriptional regulator [Thermodesulfovibrionales bacterium]|nr:sigma-54 dependent transcriptional regulator [Thermodesulfovibrionales bacterium]
MAVVVIADDEKPQREIIKEILIDEGYEVYTAGSVDECLVLINKILPDVVITDLKMGKSSGLEILDKVQKDELSPVVIIMTAFGTVSTAVEAMKKGAFDYLTKPLDKDSLVLTVKKAVERMQLLKENIKLKEALIERFRIDGIVGHSKKMNYVVEIAKKAAPTNVTVLIYGESGTGKELIAKAIHYNSPRAKGPFVALNCSAIPENLIESELFGYEAGAFTGANYRKIGLFESSDKGTLFLDEIGDMPMLVQAKLLRVLQDKEIRRLGGKDTIKVDNRIIAATNKDLSKEVAQGRFREDLYYRLRVVTIELPPLRDRIEDIPLLANYFINKYNKEFGKSIKGLSNETVKLMQSYNWPGNIRQLEFIMERAVLMSDSEFIMPADIKDELKSEYTRQDFEFHLPSKGIVFEELEKQLIRQALIKSNCVVAKAARLLGMTDKTFRYRLEKYDISIPPSSNEATTP